MTPQAAPVIAAQELREVRRGVAGAADAQVLKVVRMVDALETRGDADAVLAPIRARLRTIQPARPLRFSRLMFMPADPLIAAPAAWRSGGPFIPRQALVVLAEAVRKRITATPAGSEALARIDAAIFGATTADTEIVTRVGAQLWPPASGALRALSEGSCAEASRAWEATGLPAGELAPMARGLAAILAVAPRLHGPCAPADGLPELALVEMLAKSHAFGPRASAMMLCLLMIRAPQACNALLASAEAVGIGRAVSGAAAEVALDWVEREIKACPLSVTSDSSGELNRQASLLDALASQPADSAHRKRVLQARGALLESSLQRFEATLRESVIDPLATLKGDDEALNAMESSARQLRAFEIEARRLGGGAKFDEAVSGLNRVVRDAASLGPMDRARLLELLIGPEAALKALAGKA